MVSADMFSSKPVKLAISDLALKKETGQMLQMVVSRKGHAPRDKHLGTTSMMVS